MSMRDEFEKAAAAVKSAYEEGFDDGMQMLRSDFDQCWSESKAKGVYDSLLSSAAREQGAEPVAFVAPTANGSFFRETCEELEKVVANAGATLNGTIPLYTQPQSAGVPEAFMLRKQAEAVEYFGQPFDRMHRTISSRKVAEDAFEYANQLRQQADELEQK